MNFELGEEQLMLKTSAREFLAKECPKKLVRDIMTDERGYSAELWQKMSHLGWQGLVIPEKYGGIGSTFLDLIVILGEMGRVLVPGPFIPTVVLAGRPILAAGTEEQKRQFLPKISKGENILTLALMEPSGSIDADGISVNAMPSGDDFIIDGTKLFVPNANVANYLLVVARTKNYPIKDDGITIFLVNARSAGIHIEALKTLTGEKLCEVIFRNVVVPKSQILGNLNQGWPIVKRILYEAIVAECAVMMGGAGWVLEMSVQYAKDRMQFGLPIGSFQAIQHKCSNMVVEIEGGTSITYYAAWTITENDPNLPLAASMAKAWCSDTYKHCAAEGIQIHGGIGFTWDHDIHLYFKKAKTSEVSYGDGDYHREAIARMLDL